MTQLIRRNITLTRQDYATVSKHAQQWGQSFSASLRLIIREWKLFKQQRQTEAEAQTEPGSPTILS